jgi:hypothetical protein
VLLIHNIKPDLLILDEPTNSLDPHGIHEFREIVKSLAKDTGISVLISSHLYLTGSYQLIEGISLNFSIITFFLWGLISLIIGFQIFNRKAILSRIRNLNPETQIALIGLYNPKSEQAPQKSQKLILRKVKSRALGIKMRSSSHAMRFNCFPTYHREYLF